MAKEQKTSKNKKNSDEQKKIDKIDKYISDSDYQIKSQCAIEILMAKLQLIDSELSRKKGRTVVSQITSRIKNAQSVYAKLVRKGLKPDFNTARSRLNDLVGVRVVCPFEDEVYEVANLLKCQGDIEVIKEKDYIKSPKKNGYRSLHVILELPIYFGEGFQKERVEVQFRTVAMDYWSVLDYQLFYKKKMDENGEIAKELKKYAEDIARLDARMLKLRNKIEEI